MNRHHCVVATTTHWKGALAAVGLLLVPVGCSVTDAKSTATTEPAVTLAATDSTSASAPTSTPPASTPLTTTPLTTTTTSTTTTTTMPDPCAGFNALTLSGQMQQVRDNTAPTDPACAPALTNATQAVAAFDQISNLDRQFENPGSDVVSATIECDGTATMRMTNNFTSPILSWGYFYEGGQDVDTTRFRPTFGEVIAPGVSGTMTSGRPGVDGCNSRAVFLVGVESFRPFARPNSAAPGSPQASSDPAVWFPALQEQLNIGRESGSLEYLIDNVYDLHSLYLLDDLNRSATPDGSAHTPSKLMFCRQLDVPPPAGSDGEWATLLLSGESGVKDETNTLFMGLFSRGIDGVWRIDTIDLGIAYPYDPANPCAAPPQF